MISQLGTVPSLAFNGPAFLSLIWTAWVIWGVGRLGTVFSFKEISRFERAALRVATGIATTIVISILLHAIGYGIGLVRPDGVNMAAGYPQIKHSTPFFSFGILQLSIIALAGYAIDIREWYIRFKAGKRFEFFERLRRAMRPPVAKSFIHYAGPEILVVVIAVIWFIVFYKWAMHYAWLADNDPWDHSWAVHWITRSGSFYEPLVNHVNPKTGVADPVQIFHYLDAYPPGMDLFLSIPTLMYKSNIIWNLKFYAALLAPVGLILIYPTAVRLAEIGLALNRFRDVDTGDLAVYRKANQSQPDIHMTPLKVTARWIGALGIVALSCIPGYPSRFIWSHMLILIIWAAALMPILRLRSSWKWAVPAVWLLAATQEINTTAGFKLGANIIFLFIAAVTFLPGRRRTRFFARPGFYAAVTFIVGMVFIWFTTAALNKTIREGVGYTQPISNTIAPAMISYNELVAEETAALRRVREAKRSNDKTVVVQVERERREKTRAIKTFRKKNKKIAGKLVRLRASQLDELKQSADAGGVPEYTQRISREYARKLIRYSVLKRAVDSGTPASDVLKEALGALREKNDVTLDEFLSAYVGEKQAADLDTKKKALGAFRRMLQDNRERKILPAFYALYRRNELATRIKDLKKTLASESNQKDKDKKKNEAKEHDAAKRALRNESLSQAVAQLNELESRIDFSSAAMTRAAKAWSALSSKKRAAYTDVLKWDVASRILPGLTDANIQARLKQIDAAVRNVDASRRERIDSLKERIRDPETDPADPELAGVLLEQIKSLYQEHVQMMNIIGKRRVKALTSDQVIELKASLRDVDGQIASLKRWILIELSLTALAVLLTLGAHIVLFGLKVALPAVRILAVGASALVLAMAWWGPMFARYYGKPPGIVRIRDSYQTKRQRDPGKFNKIIETLAHPADIQLDRYVELPPWKCKGTQDRNYAAWEYVQPPSKTGIPKKKIRNSVTSGIGLGVSVTYSLIAFPAMAVFLIVLAFWRRNDGELIGESDASGGSDPRSGSGDGVAEADAFQTDSSGGDVNSNKKLRKDARRGDSVNVAGEASTDRDAYDTVAPVLPARAADLQSVQADDITYLTGRNFNYAVVLGLCLMLAHSIIGLKGYSKNVPFELFAFRYWHMISFVGVFSLIVLMAWAFPWVRKMKRYGVVVPIAFLIVCIATIRYTKARYLEVSDTQPNRQINELKTISDRLAGQQSQVRDPATRKRLNEIISSYNDKINGLEMKKEASRRAENHLMSTWPILFLLFAGLLTVVQIFILGGAPSPNTGAFSRLSLFAANSLLMIMIGYTVVQGAAIRSDLNGFAWKMTGVMDDGNGTESRAITRLITSKDAMDMKPGERIYPMGGPYRFRFMLAAGMDVSYFDYDTYNFIHENILKPQDNPFGVSTSIKKLESFYDLTAIRTNRGLRYFANWPVMPILNRKNKAGKMVPDKSALYSYQPDPDRVDYKMGVQRMPWLQLAMAGNKTKTRRIARPDTKNFPKFFHEWLVKNQYEYIWFDHVFFQFTRTPKGRVYFLPGSGKRKSREYRANLFEMVLNDCLQSGYFELVPGQDVIPEYSTNRYTKRYLKNRLFPNLPCYFLRVRKERNPDAVYPYWLPAPDTITYKNKLPGIF